MKKKNTEKEREIRDCSHIAMENFIRQERENKRLYSRLFNNIMSLLLC